MEYDNKNTFVLFNHEKKTDKQPDSKGNGNFVCQKCNHKNEVELAVWQRTSKKGTPFLSGKVSEPYQKPEGNSWQQAREKFAKPDVVLTDIKDDDEDIMASIPF